MAILLDIKAKKCCGNNSPPCPNCDQSKSKKPPKWTNVYSQGTKEGDEEQRFFIALSRDPQYAWRSVAAVSKESGLSEKRVEEILNKYYNKGMVFQSPTNETMWGYWERVPEMLPKQQPSVVRKDQQKRIKSSSKGSHHP